MNREKKPNSRQKSIRLSFNLIENIEKMAKEENRTFNNMVETILIQATQSETMNRA